MSNYNNKVNEVIFQIEANTEDYRTITNQIVSSLVEIGNPILTDIITSIKDLFELLEQVNSLIESKIYACCKSTLIISNYTKGINETIKAIKHSQIKE